MSYVTANATYGSSKFLYSYCSLGSFIVSLLGTGYGVPLNTTTITVLPSALGLSYAAGAMIYSVNNLPWALNVTNNSTTVTDGAAAPVPIALSAGLGVPLALFIVGFLVLLFCFCRSGGVRGGQRASLTAMHNRGEVAMTQSPFSGGGGAAPGSDWGHTGKPAVGPGV